MAVVSIDPVSDSRWDALQSLAGGGLFHSPAWIAAVRDTYGFAPRAIILTRPDGSARAGVSYCRIDDALGSRLVCFPFADVCDPLLLDAEAWPALFAALASDELPITFRCLDDRIPASAQLVVTKRARWQQVPVDVSLDVMRARVSEATRRGIAKATRADVVVRPLEGDTAIDDFVRLHVRLRKQKYRLLAQPSAFFHAIATQFQPLGLWHALGAYQGDRLLAATIYLRWGDTLYYKFNASDPAALDLRPNNVLAWEGLKLAQRTGCRLFDFGPSDDTQPGLIRFKRGFGATEREVRFLSWKPEGPAQFARPAMRTALSQLTQLFTATDVPDGATAEAGSVLYRLFV